MYNTFAQLVADIDDLESRSGSLMEDCAPVPFFGDLGASRVATVGINPSNREFVDSSGNELDGDQRRFHTISSLGLKSWSEVTGRDLHRITIACSRYFRARPYDAWFRVLQQVLSPSQLSYYGSHPSVCHLDLVPYATSEKWGSLRTADQRLLLTSAARAFAETVRDSGIDSLVLNGQTVVSCFEQQSRVVLTRTHEATWDLERTNGPRVAGFGYAGDVTSLSGIELGRSIRVIGYNHNLQSSFGVTSTAKNAIGSWIKEMLGR